jgi:hypothetical protein
MWGRIRNRVRIRNRRWRWKMRRGRWGWCAFTPRSGISIRTRLECSGFRQAGIWSAAISTHFEKRLYPAVDAADKESCRPDFAVAIYPGHPVDCRGGMGCQAGAKKFVVPHPATADKNLGLNPEVPVTSQTPPTFLLQAEDDHVDSVYDSLAYYIALQKAGVPVEMHLYAQGGTCVWAAAYQVSDNAMATVGGDVAGDDWDNLEVGARLQTRRSRGGRAGISQCWPPM